MVSIKSAPNTSQEPTTRGDGRERILDESRTRFLDKGFSATSMQEIADAVGMTKPALYYHFEDKNELFLAVVAREMDRGYVEFNRNMQAHAHISDRLEAGAIYCFQMIQGDIGQMMSDLHRFVPAERVVALKAAHPQPVEMVAEMLTIARENGEIGPDENVQDLAQLFIGSIFGQLSMIACQQCEQSNAVYLGKLAARVFMDGVGTPATR